MKIIAKRDEEYFLVLTEGDRGFVLNAKLRVSYPETSVHSIIARGYWNEIELPPDEEKALLEIASEKGGRGSGHHRHAGRPGKKGGSLPGKGGINPAIDIIEVNLEPEKPTQELLDKTRIYRGDGNVAELSRLQSWVSCVPCNKPLGAVDEIVICRGRDDLTNALIDHAEELTARKLSDEEREQTARAAIRTAAAFDPIKRKIFIRSPAVTNPLAFFHELGHAVYFGQDGSEAVAAWDDEWKNNEGFDRVSKYSEKSAVEAFAETFAAYITVSNQHANWERAKKAHPMQDFSIGDDNVRLAFNAVYEVLKNYN